MSRMLLFGGSAPAPLQTVLPLRRRGHCFERVDGTRWTAIEHTDFHVFGRAENGEDVDPVFKQRSAAGYNLLRIGTRYQLSPYGIGDCTLAMHPTLYDDLRPFARRAAHFGLYLDVLSYFGREDFDPSHWERLQDALNGEPNVLLSLVNENDQPGNHIDLAPYPSPKWLLGSHGSNGSQVQPPLASWHWTELHTNGAPSEQRKIGHNAWEIWDGPSWASETSRFPDVGMWGKAGDGAKTFETWLQRCERLAFDSAAGGVLLSAGSGCFHSRAGKASMLWDTSTERVALAWVAGARSVDLAFQDGGYRHRNDVEDAEDPIGTSLLRVYQRGNSPLVRIRCNVGENRRAGD